MTNDLKAKHHQRRRTVREFFEREGWGNVELLDGWDGEDLEELRTVLDDEEFQTLLDHLEDQDSR
jgi:hypothetical protein